MWGEGVGVGCGGGGGEDILFSFTQAGSVSHFLFTGVELSAGSSHRPQRVDRRVTSVTSVTSHPTLNWSFFPSKQGHCNNTDAQ